VEERHHQRNLLSQGDGNILTVSPDDLLRVELEAQRDLFGAMEIAFENLTPTPEKRKGDLKIPGHQRTV
jgi:hypothetical protein